MPKLPQTALRTLRAPRTLKALVCVFFVCFLLLGLVTAGDYGQPWDELDEMGFLRMNLWEYTRAFGMDERVFEDWERLDNAYISKLVPISENSNRDHGEAAFYPLAGIMMDSSRTESERQLCWHMYCWALFTLGAFALYACCRELGLSRFFSLLGAFMLLISPRFFAEGHYNNKDVVLMSLTLCVQWQGLRLMKRPTFPCALLFAFFGALAANTKIVGIALWGLTALFVLIWQIVRKNLSLRVICVGLTAMLGFAAMYMLLTPAMWSAPLEFLGYLFGNAVSFSRWKNDVLFRGVVFDTSVAPLPWYYLPYMIVATTPLWALLLIAAGQVAAIPTILSKKCNRNNGLSLKLLLVTLMWLLPLGFAIISRTNVFNGWRHFYFLYAPMLVLAAWGLNCLWRRLCRMRPRWLRRAFAVMMALCMLFTGVGVALNHPYQYVYYQPLVSLLRGQDWLEADYWNVSVRNALEELCAKTEGELAIGYADLWAEIGLRRNVYALPQALRDRIAITEDVSVARYVLANPTYDTFSGFVPSVDMAEAVSLNAYDRTIMRIYERTASR